MKIDNVIENIKRQIPKITPDQMKDCILTLLLFIAYITIANSFKYEITGLPIFVMFTSIHILIIFMGVSALWFYFKKKNLRFILALIAIAAGIYINTYPGEYIQKEEDIRSTVFIEKSENITFTSLNADITFERNRTILNQKLKFGTEHFLEGVVLYDLTPPNSTTRYKIKIAKLDNNRWTTIYNNTNGSITNKSFPELKDQKFSVDRGGFGFYEIDITYVLPIIKPHTRVDFILQGSYLNKPPIDDLFFEVKFSELLYGCLTPCIISSEENIELGPSYQRIYRNTYSKLEEPYTIHSIKAKDTNEIGFFIRGTNKFAVVLRNFMLAIIAGLTLMMMQILIKDKKEEKS